MTTERFELEARRLEYAWDHLMADDKSKWSQARWNHFHRVRDALDALVQSLHGYNDEVENPMMPLEED